MLVTDLNAVLPACQCRSNGSMPCACVTGAPSASPNADSVRLVMWSSRSVGITECVPLVADLVGSSV